MKAHQDKSNNAVNIARVNSSQIIPITVITILLFQILIKIKSTF